MTLDPLASKMNDFFWRREQPESNGLQGVNGDWLVSERGFYDGDFT